jgi:hypothetical protein
MHGGAPGSGAPSGERNGNYRHGFYTAEAITERRDVRALLRGTSLRMSGDHARSIAEPAHPAASAARRLLGRSHYAGPYAITFAAFLCKDEEAASVNWKEMLISRNQATVG